MCSDLGFSPLRGRRVWVGDVGIGHFSAQLLAQQMYMAIGRPEKQPPCVLTFFIPLLHIYQCDITHSYSLD